jgi:predicted nucleic acid-binding protein
VNFLLDTNVLSEMVRPAPELKVLEWLSTVDEDRVFMSVATIAEVRRGIALMAEGRRRTALADWLANDLSGRFAGRVLSIDVSVAEHWGDLLALSRQSGLALSAIDGFFAATALAKGLILVTRNTKDFLPFDIPLFDPWTGEGKQQ